MCFRVCQLCLLGHVRMEFKSSGNLPPAPAYVAREQCQCCTMGGQVGARSSRDNGYIRVLLDSPGLDLSSMASKINS